MFSSAWKEKYRRGMLANGPAPDIGLNTEMLRYAFIVS